MAKNLKMKAASIQSFLSSFPSSGQKSPSKVVPRAWQMFTHNGRGSIIGTVFGTLIVAVMNNLLNLIGVDPVF